jgi:hypothetical protein
MAWLIAVDILAATIIFGSHDKTISRVAAEAELEGEMWGAVVCSVLDAFDDGHCAWALETK